MTALHLPGRMLDRVPAFNALGFTAVTLGLFAFFGWIFSLVDAAFGLPQLLAPPYSLLGAVPLVVGLLLRYRAALAFYANKLEILSLDAPAKLLTAGPYALSRNPHYLSLFLMGGGVVVLFNSASALLPLAAGALLLKSIVDYEEAVLYHAFGEDYLEYKRAVPRWI